MRQFSHNFRKQPNRSIGPTTIDRYIDQYAHINLNRSLRTNIIKYEIILYSDEIAHIKFLWPRRVPGHMSAKHLSMEVRDIRLLHRVDFPNQPNIAGICLMIKQTR